MKIKNYDIACLSYASHPKKIEGSYVVSVSLDDKYNFRQVSVKNPEEGLELINQYIKGYTFEVEPDLEIKETNHLGRHIFSKHYECNSTN